MLSFTSFFPLRTLECRCFLFLFSHLYMYLLAVNFLTKNLAISPMGDRLLFASKTLTTKQTLHFKTLSSGFRFHTVTYNCLWRTFIHKAFARTLFTCVYNEESRVCLINTDSKISQSEQRGRRSALLSGSSFATTGCRRILKLSTPKGWGARPLCPLVFCDFIKLPSGKAQAMS